MATTTLPLYDSTLQNLTISNLRAPSTTSDAPSMADSLTPLNFKFDELRATMGDFSRRFDVFIEQGRRRVLEERNQFRMSVAEIQDQHIQTTRAITTLHILSYAHTNTLTSQAAETADMHTQIASLTQTRDAHLSRTSAVKSKLATTKAAAASLKAIQRQERMYGERQAERNAQEIRAVEEVLGLRVEGCGVEDRVRFVFTGLTREGGSRGQEGRDWEKSETVGEGEAFFDLDMAGKDGVAFDVTECRPRLDGTKVEEALRCMREGEDLRGFLKRMRGLFAGHFER